MAYRIAATEKDKLAHKETDHVGPLHCWVKANGVKLAVEWLGISRSEEEPKYLLVAPDGFIFHTAWQTTETCRTMQEVMEFADLYPPIKQDAPDI